MSVVCQEPNATSGQLVGSFRVRNYTPAAIRDVVTFALPLARGVLFGGEDLYTTEQQLGLSTSTARVRVEWEKAGRAYSDGSCSQVKCWVPAQCAADGQAGSVRHVEVRRGTGGAAGFALHPDCATWRTTMSAWIEMPGAVVDLGGPRVEWTRIHGNAYVETWRIRRRFRDAGAGSSPLWTELVLEWRANMPHALATLVIGNSDWTRSDPRYDIGGFWSFLTNSCEPLVHHARILQGAGGGGGGSTAWRNFNTPGGDVQWFDDGRMLVRRMRLHFGTPTAGSIEASTQAAHASGLYLLAMADTWADHGVAGAFGVVPQYPANLGAAPEPAASADLDAIRRAAYNGLPSTRPFVAPGIGANYRPPDTGDQQDITAIAFGPEMRTRDSCFGLFLGELLALQEGMRPVHFREEVSLDWLRHASFGPGTSRPLVQWHWFMRPFPGPGPSPYFLGKDPALSVRAESYLAGTAMGAWHQYDREHWLLLHLVTYAQVTRDRWACELAEYLCGDQFLWNVEPGANNPNGQRPGPAREWGRMLPSAMTAAWAFDRTDILDRALALQTAWTALDVQRFGPFAQGAWEIWNPNGNNLPDRRWSPVWQHGIMVEGLWAAVLAADRWGRRGDASVYEAGAWRVARWIVQQCYRDSSPLSDRLQLQLWNTQAFQTVGSAPRIVVEPYPRPGDTCRNERTGETATVVYVNTTHVLLRDFTTRDWRQNDYLTFTGASPVPAPGRQVFARLDTYRIAKALWWPDDGHALTRAEMEAWPNPVYQGSPANVEWSDGTGYDLWCACVPAFAREQAIARLDFATWQQAQAVVQNYLDVHAPPSGWGPMGSTRYDTHQIVATGQVRDLPYTG